MRAREVPSFGLPFIHILLGFLDDDDEEENDNDVVGANP